MLISIQFEFKMDVQKIAPSNSTPTTWGLNSSATAINHLVLAPSLGDHVAPRLVAQAARSPWFDTLTWAAKPWAKTFSSAAGRWFPRELFPDPDPQPWPALEPCSIAFLLSPIAKSDPGPSSGQKCF